MKDDKGERIVTDYKPEDMELKSSVGGPCIYIRGVFPDGKETGRIELGPLQTAEDLRQACFDTLKTGRDDVRSFVDSICGSSRWR